MILQLSQIVVNSGTQVRAAINEETVASYAERMTEGDTFPPVIVFHDGNVYHLADGFHRYMAASRNEFRDIDADVRTGTATDALWFALAANRTNGQRLNNGDLQHAVKLALQTWPDKTQKAISEQVGCSQAYVAKVKSEYHSDNENRTITNSRGQTRPSSYRKAVSPADVVKAAAVEKEEKTYTEASLPPDSKKEETGNGFQLAIEVINRLLLLSPSDPSRARGIEMLMGSIYADNGGRTLDHSVNLRRAWKYAGKAEREEFLKWIKKGGAE